MSQEEYIHWPTNADVPLIVTIVNDQGIGVAGLTPEVSIQRYKPVGGSGLLDMRYWDPVGMVFTPAPTWIPVPPQDAVEHPGRYVFVWEQTVIGIEQVYMVGYRNTIVPKGRANEIHVITNEVYIPSTQPDPIIFGPNSIMGQLQIMKDGGVGDFDPLKHPLSKIGIGYERILGLLHHNAMVDKQLYDSNGQLTSARLRVFDSEATVPAVPGGVEVGTQEYAITAEYAGLNNLISYVLKQVL